MEGMGKEEWKEGILGSTDTLANPGILEENSESFSFPGPIQMLVRSPIKTSPKPPGWFHMVPQKHLAKRSLSRGR